MLVRFTKALPAAKADELTCVRTDGSTTVMEMRRQGILPHEAFHYVVETSLGWRDGLFGAVERGEALEEVHTRLHARRGGCKMPQGLQAEALIECLEAQQWGGALDPAGFAEALVRTCRRRAVPPPEITSEELDRVRTALRHFGAAWRPLVAGAALEKRF